MLSAEDPMKLKSVFRRSGPAQQKRNIIKSRRRKERKNLLKNGELNAISIGQTKTKNAPNTNIFMSLSEE